MNLKNMTMALIIALVYEMLLKLSHIVIPTLFNVRPVSAITSLLSFFIFVIIVLFLLLFYKKERFSQEITVLIKVLIGCFVLSVALRLPIIQNLIDHHQVRLLQEIVGFVQAVLLFIFSIFYKSTIPSGERLMRNAALFITVMFGIGIIKSLYSLIIFSRFVISGISVNFSPIFNGTMVILFLITHGSLIYFLYRYYQFKFGSE